MGHEPFHLGQRASLLPFFFRALFLFFFSYFFFFLLSFVYGSGLLWELFAGLWVGYRTVSVTRVKTVSERARVDLKETAALRRAACACGNVIVH